MTRTKKTALLISALAIVLCAAVITGATFALFTDGEQYAIGVNTGKIDVEGTLTLNSAWSEAQTTGKRTEAVVSGNSATVAQGGTVTLTEGNTVTFNLMSLGDGAKMSLSFANNSTVNMQYRITVSVTGEAASEFLRDNLTIKVGDGDAVNMFNAEDTVYTITDWTAVAANSAIDTVSFEIALPWSALSASEGLAENQSVSITVSMEAIQGNADASAQADA